MGLSGALAFSLPKIPSPPQVLYSACLLKNSKASFLDVISLYLRISFCGFGALKNAPTVLSVLLDCSLPIFAFFKIESTTLFNFSGDTVSTLPASYCFITSTNCCEAE